MVCARVIIKKNIFFANFALLLLCGDVALNPGPTYPCGICTVDVEDTDRAILYDMCETWYHVSCDPLISDDMIPLFNHQMMIHGFAPGVFRLVIPQYPARVHLIMRH